MTDLSDTVLNHQAILVKHKSTILAAYIPRAAYSGDIGGSGTPSMTTGTRAARWGVRAVRHPHATRMEPQEGGPHLSRCVCVVDEHESVAVQRSEDRRKYP